MDIRTTEKVEGIRLQLDTGRLIFSILKEPRLIISISITLHCMITNGGQELRKFSDSPLEQEVA